MFREGLASLLASQPDIQVVGAAGSMEEAIYLAQSLHPEVVLMNYTLPDGDGPEATRAILVEDPGIQVVFLSDLNGDERLFAAIRSGAKGYLLKNLPISKLVTYLRGLEQNEAALSGEMTIRILEEFSRQYNPYRPDRTRLSGLTSREVEVLKELAAGATNEEIAMQLRLSVNTVKSHIHNLLRKLDLKNRKEAAKIAINAE